jgi:tRNA A-37 threonylcarbamoyl transferase component Bud32
MTTDDRLDEVLDAWQVAAEAGWDVAVAELCRGCPDLLSEVERRVAVMQRVQALATPPVVAEADTRELVKAPDTLIPNGPPTNSPVRGVTDSPGLRLIRVLGEGGMGRVWEAEDTTLRRRVAVKVMHPHVAARPEARERFLREARSAAAVHHDHVVPVFQVGEAAGMPFLAMPLLAGESLEARLKRDAVVSVAEAIRLARQAAEGLAAAHAKGLVHRDVKPGNLWLEALGEPATAAAGWRVKVLDFGLARWAEAADGLTQPGSVLGTPGYMAPEQANGEMADARADLFSLGCVLYRMLAGRPAFGANTLTAALRAVAEHHPPPPAEVRPEVPMALSALTMRLLAKRPEDRPASAQAVASELRALEQARPVSSPVAPVRRVVWATVAATGLVAAAAALIAIRGNSLATPNANPTVRGPTPLPALKTPLRVMAIHVNHFARQPDGQADPQGVLGRDSFAPVEGDQVTVEAVLSRPAYAFLLACRPDGVVEVCFPEDEAEPPMMTDRVTYPSKDRGVRYGLTDGAGVYAFAVVASDAPLPAYREWLAGKTLPWLPELATGKIVWIDDGTWVEAVGPNGVVRGDRGKGTRVAGQGAVVRLTDWLKGHGAAAAVGFVTGPRD